MSEKKQHAYKALDNDALENVSGGWYTRGFERLYLTTREANWLNDHGYTSVLKSKIHPYKYGANEEPYKVLYDPQGKAMTIGEIAATLNDARFDGRTLK